MLGCVVVCNESFLAVQVAFVDPPYGMMEEEKPRLAVLDMVAGLCSVMEAGGVVMVRTPREIELPELEPYDGPAAAAYGGMRLHFYQMPLAD